MTTLVCISDTHGCHPQLNDLPEGDILVHAGDWCAHSSYDDTISFLKWFESQPHQHKVFIAGNHETWVEDNWLAFAELAQQYAPSCTYLNDSGITIGDLNIWGSPISPTFQEWAFGRERGPAIQRHWNMIPRDTHVLITHCPPAGILDAVPSSIFETYGTVEHVGCANLDRTIRFCLPDLRAHIFGLVHWSGGKKQVLADVVYVNASVVDAGYTLTNKPVLIGF